MSLLKPYYNDERSGIKIYLVDCREILPTLPKADLILTDPPYGIGEDGGRFRDRKGGGHRVLPKMGWDTSTPDKETFGLILESSHEQIIWGGNYFTDKLPVSRGWLYWNKMMGGNFSDGELAWTSIDMVLKSFSKCNKMPGKEHPTQKPVELMQWCFGFVPDAKTIVDPFMGSGTTLRAAKDLGRKAIGIEIEEHYCEIAAKRCQQEVLNFGDVANEIKNSGIQSELLA